MRKIATACLSAAVCFCFGPAQGLEVKVCALVQAKAPEWEAIPASAVIDPGRLSFKKKVFLESRKEIPVWANSVKRSLNEATSSLSSRDRKSLPKVLSAIEEWMAGNIVGEQEIVNCPAVWRSAAQVLDEKRGNSFELARAAVAMLRAAGVPARPTYDGFPLVYIYVTPPGKTGFWTVWSPFSAGSSRALPVLWLPLRAEEVALASIHPKSASCRPIMEGRRYADEEKARHAFAHCKENGRFPEGESWLPGSGVKDWWEVWTIGAELGPASETVSMVFPLPFVKGKGYGTREHAVWISDQSVLSKSSRMLSRTDQMLGGLLLSIKVWIEPKAERADDA